MSSSVPAILTRIDVETDRMHVDIILLGETSVTFTEDQAEDLRARLADAVEAVMSSFWPVELEQAACAA